MKTNVYKTDGACPKCGERYELEGGSIEIDSTGEYEYAWQWVTCLECGCRFVNVYRYYQSETYEEG